MKELKEYFRNKEISNVLDIGCGSGDFTRVLIEVFPNGTKITGIDPYEEPLTEARKNFTSTNIEFIQMSGEEINYPDNSFDVVTISFALHHLSDVTKTLSEMKRVVKPDGRLIINEIVSDVQNEAQGLQKMQHHLKSFVDRINGIPHRDTYSIEEVKKIIAENEIAIDHSFINLKMPKPNLDAEFLEERMNMMVALVDQLKGHEAYSEKKQLLQVFEETYLKHGYQMAPSVVVIGKK